MLAEGDVDGRDFVGQPVGDHPTGSVCGLFGGLKQRDQRSAPMLLPRSQQLSRAQQAGDVHVVAAGVCHRHRGLVARPSRHRGTGVGQPGVLTDGECVHIRAEQHRRAIPVSQHPDDSGTAHPGGHLEAELLQSFSNDGCRAVLLMGKFRVLVQLSVEILLPDPGLFGGCQNGRRGAALRCQRRTAAQAGSVRCRHRC